MSEENKNIDSGSLNEKLINTIELNNISYDKQKLDKTLEFAQRIYDDKKRDDGQDTYNHSLGVAIEVAKLNMDQISIYSAILHEIDNISENDKKYIIQNISPDVITVIDGMKRLNELNYIEQDEVEIEKLRDMFMAIAKDIRVVIVKLADVLYDMRYIKNVDEKIQKQRARETLEIYAPIAHRLGMSQIKSEMEDSSFRVLDETDYQIIKKDIDEKKEERQQYIHDRIEEITNALGKVSVKATVFGRPKHFYSIFRKMKDKGYPIDDIYDLLAIRIIVNSIKDCYTALGIVHEMYKPMPGRFKDYIAVPKTNMYQSLHTTVFGANGKPFEVQIRTWDMNNIAEYGVAAHFLYKEKSQQMSENDKKIVWLRQTLEMQRQLKDGSANVRDLKIELFGEEVFVFTPKGQIKALPKGSTPVDFAYMIHQKIAEQMIGAKINSKMVPINTKLNNADIVEIVTSKNASGPSTDWLKFVKTSNARGKIISFLKKKGKDVNIQKGKEAFEKELKHQRISKDMLLKSEYVDEMLRRCKFNTIEECYENIGFGSIQAFVPVRKLVDICQKDIEHKDEFTQNLNKQEMPNKKHTTSDGVIVEGIDNCLVKFSKCCNPIPGDQIIGYITYGNGVSIHRKDCKNLKNLDMKTRSINVKWQDKVKLSFIANIDIMANDRNDLIADVLKKLQDLKIQVVSIKAKNFMSRQAIISVSINVDSNETLQKVMKEIKKIDSVYDIKRAK